MRRFVTLPEIIFPLDTFVLAREVGEGRFQIVYCPELDGESSAPAQPREVTVTTDAETLRGQLRGTSYSFLDDKPVNRVVRLGDVFVVRDCIQSVTPTTGDPASPASLVPRAGGKTLPAVPLTLTVAEVADALKPQRGAGRKRRDGKGRFVPLDTDGPPDTTIPARSADPRTPITLDGTPATDTPAVDATPAAGEPANVVDAEHGDEATR